MNKILLLKNTSIEKKRLISNFFSLSSIEIANYLFPIITVPYLVRKLGPSKYGLTSFAWAFIQYFAMITDYGFNLTATRSVSVSRDYRQKINRIFSSVMVVKLMLMLLSLTALLIIATTFSKFKGNILIYLFAFGQVIGSVLFPIWFFQGMEKMKSIATLNLIAKAIFLISIFIFIKNETDYIYVPLLMSLGSILAGLISLYIIFNKFKIRIILPTLKELGEQLNESKNAFISMISISLITSSNTFILGLFATNEIVGYFSAAEKLITLAFRAFNPILASVYPYISKIADASKDSAIKTIRKLFVIIVFLSFGVFIGIIIFSKPVVLIALGSKFLASVPIVRILSPLVFIIPVAFIFANLVLLPFKLDRYFARIYILGGIINITLILTLLSFLKMGASGVAFSLLISHITILILLYGALKRNNISIINMDMRELLILIRDKVIVNN